MDDLEFKVLLIEDDSDDYLLVRHWLSEISTARYDLEWARTYEAGLEMALRTPHDVCLLDYRLGTRDGVELLLELFSRGHNAPVILLTGQGDHQIDGEAMIAGAAGYLVKSEITPSLLERFIRYAVNHKRTERKELDHRLLKTQKLEAIGTLAGGIAHDFNNILSAIIGYSEILLDDTPDISPRRNDIEQVLRAGRRAKNLVRQILDFSRREGHPESTPVEMESIVDEALKLIRATVPVTIEIRRSTSCADLILADATQIHQVIVNLCTNAAYAMRDQQGILEVGLQTVELGEGNTPACLEGRSGAYLQLSVRDTGHGMDSATLKRIYDPYFSTKDAAEGTGLGLAVVHGIVNRHKGAIHVESEQGKGTCFHVFFPRIESAALKKGEATEEIPGGNERILLIEDEEPLAHMGKRMLQNLGYRVVTHTNGSEALDLLRAAPDAFDLVITDHIMPHKTGLDLSRELHEMRPQLPVILCTGFNEPVKREEIPATGIRALLMKPIPKSELARTVRHVLDSQRRAEISPLEKRILLVDDEDMTRETIRQMLERGGYTVFDAPDADGGMRICRDESIDLVITDVLMPDKDGLELIQEIRKEVPEMKIIAISGGGAKGTTAYLASAELFGAHLTIQKPFERQEILDAVKILLG